MSKTAIFDSECEVCGHPICKGDFTQPYCIAGISKIKWSHKGCLASDDPRIPHCKHWVKTGSFSGKKRYGAGQRKRVYNEGRAGAIRRWLLQVFGEEYLSSGSGVLEVAGGKGELSFELCNLNNVPSCVFDPRPLDVSRFAKKLNAGYYHRNEVLRSFNSCPNPKTHPELCPVTKVPNHIRGYFEMESEKEGGFDSSGVLFPRMLSTESEYLNGCRLAVGTRWTRKGLEEHEDDDDEEQVVEESDALAVDEEVETGIISIDDLTLTESVLHSYQEAQEIVKNCSVIVGLHPDQATEHILRFAIANNKPAVILPCCVYGKAFPNRRFNSNRRVTNYGEFVDYLLELMGTNCFQCSPKATTAEQRDSSNEVNSGLSNLSNCDFGAVEMDFEGKNVLLYYLNGHPPLNDPAKPHPHISRGPADSSTWWDLSTNQSKQTTAS